jgi:TusA-related sulfurtransferase
VLRTERALAGLAPGEVLEIVATDPVAELDLAVFSQRSGHELLSVRHRGDELVFRIRKAGLSPP